jgi:thiol peroxidase
MAQLKFKGEPANTVGDLPKLKQTISFKGLLKSNLHETSSADYKGKRKVLNIFPSIDTGVCATSVRQFNKLASGLKNTVVLNVSMDLPFALTRFCGAEGITNCETLSAFRSNFGTQFGVALKDTPFNGLFARAVVVLNENDEVLHVELVQDIVQEPNYDSAIKVLS